MHNAFTFLQKYLLIITDFLLKNVYRNNTRFKQTKFIFISARYICTSTFFDPYPTWKF